MADCCLIKKVATVEVYENKNEVRAYGFMAGDRNTPVMEVRFKHLWGESNLSTCKLRWIIVDDVGSLLVGEVPIQSDNTALINLPNELFTGDRRMKVQLTVASCDGERILNLQQFTDLKVINSLAPNEVVEPVYQILINTIYDESQKYLKELETSYTQKYGSLDSLYKNARASLEQYLITAENGGNAEFLQGYSPAHFQKVENTINDLIASTKYSVGDVVEVLGYYEKGDGAGHPRIKKPVGYTGADAVIGADGSIWACSDIEKKGYLDIRWIGAKVDFRYEDGTYKGTDVSPFIEKAINITNLHNVMKIKIIGRYWAKTPIITHGYVSLEGETLPSRKLVNYQQDVIEQKENPASYIYVGENITFLTMNGTGSEQGSGSHAWYDDKFYCKGIVFHSENKNSTLLRYKTSGAPSRPFIFEENQVIGFDKIFDTTNHSNPTSAYIMSIRKNELSNCNYVFYSEKRTDPYIANIGGLVFDSNICEQGPKFKIHGLFGANVISNNLLEATDNLFEYIEMHDRSSLLIEGNYFEENRGTWTFKADTTNKIDFYRNFSLGGYPDIVEELSKIVRTDEYIKGNIISDTNSFKNPEEFLNRIGYAVATNANLTTPAERVQRRIFKPFVTTVESSLGTGAWGGFGTYTPDYIGVDSDVGSVQLAIDSYGVLKTRGNIGKTWSNWATAMTDKNGFYGRDEELQTAITGNGSFYFSSLKWKPYWKTPSGFVDANGNAFPTTLEEENAISLKTLDTPYHAAQMSKLGILDSYHNYLSELHEYEKSQNVQSDSEIMALNILQSPVIPVEVKEYAKEYNLI